jgi:hypothetical protein
MYLTKFRGKFPEMARLLLYRGKGRKKGLKFRAGETFCLIGRLNGP